MNLDMEDWDEFIFGKLLSEIYKAEAHVKIDMNVLGRPSENTIPFISRTEANNGCDCYVENKNLTGIEAGNALVIGDTTATCSYQPEEFICGDHMVVCRAKWLNIYTGLFMVFVLNNEGYRYHYGRAFRKDLIQNTVLKLPSKNGQPNWKWMEDYIKSLHYKPITTNINHTAMQKYDTSTWEYFRLGEYFDIRKGKRLTSDDQTDGNTPYVGAIDSNNGIANYIGQEAIHEGNTISLSYNGSVGEAFYQPKPFWATDDVNVLYFRPENGIKFNQYIALFICTILKQERYRFSYGRKWVLDNMEKTMIKLPAKNGKPDWEWMEQFIKSLPFSDRIDEANQL